MKPFRYFLIGDDDPDDQELFIEALQEIDEDFVCITAFDGQEVLDKLARPLLMPDIIFLDLNMPKMNGKQCLREIKKNTLLSNIPIVIYSTSDDKKEMIEVLQSGAVFFFQKPNRFEELSRALTHIIYHDWGKKRSF